MICNRWCKHTAHLFAGQHTDLSLYQIPRLFPTQARCAFLASHPILSKESEISSFSTPSLFSPPTLLPYFASKTLSAVLLLSSHTCEHNCLSTCAKALERECTHFTWISKADKCQDRLIFHNSMALTQCNDRLIRWTFECWNDELIIRKIQSLFDLKPWKHIFSISFLQQAMGSNICKEKKWGHFTGEISVFVLVFFLTGFEVGGLDWKKVMSDIYAHQS